MEFGKHHKATVEIARATQKGEPVIVEVMGCSWSVACTELTHSSNEWGPPRITLEPMFKPAADLSPEALTAAVWSGEGLPPVGCVCELLAPGGDWQAATICYQDHRVCVWQYHGPNPNPIGLSERASKLQFRPLRTAEAREAEVNRLCKVVMAHPAYQDHNRNIDCSAAMRLAVEAIVDSKKFDADA